MEEEKEMEDSAQGEEAEEDIEDIAYSADAKADALVDVLVNKGIITREEFEKKLDEYFEEESE